MIDFWNSDKEYVLTEQNGEDPVLDKALQYLKEKYGEEGLQYRSVLDLGCGTGRLMPRFAALFSSVTGLEPDEERCDEAMEAILDGDLTNATALSMDLEEYIREFPNQTFDVVLCSRVFEHMKHETACGILESLKYVMGPGSVCLFTTTFTEGRRNSYKADAQSGQEVCLFARPWMERFLQSCGLETKQFEAYDSGESALYVCEPAEGTLLRTPCGPETASGKVCFMQFYSLDSRVSMNTAKLRNLQEEEPDETDEICEAFELAEHCLYGSQLPFPALRHYRRTEIHSEKVRIADSHAVVSFYTRSNVAQVSVCLSLENVSCDDIVYLHQIQNAAEAFFTVDGQLCSIPQLCEETLKECGLRRFSAGETSMIVELNRFGSCTDPLSLSPDDLRCLYGMLTGEEGYLHVPQERVEKTMANCWTGHDYAKVFASGSDAVLLNFNRGETYADYIDYEKPYAERYFNGLNDCFTMDAPTAGIDHGLYFALETGQLFRTVTDRFLSRDMNVNASHGFFVSDDIKQNRQIREELIRTLEQAARMTSAEPESLNGFVQRTLGVPQILGSIRSKLDLVESDLDLLYSSATNRMVTLLTVLGLLFAVLQIVNSL